MALEFPRFTVHLRNADDPEQTTAHDVVVNFQDQLRAELELSKRHMSMKGNPLNTSAAWCWASLVRTGVYSKAFDQFHGIDVAGIETEQDVTTGRPTTETVDPTQLATP
jgi:hypothetical protein